MVLPKCYSHPDYMIIDPKNVTTSSGTFHVGTPPEPEPKTIQIRLEVVQTDGSYSFPIHCPRWLFWLLSKLEY